MSTTIPAPAVSPIDDRPFVDEKALRTKARRRASLCPGAGWALLGYPGRGNLAMVCVAAWLGTLAWLVLTASPESLWAVVVTTVAWLVIWAAELIDTGSCPIRSPANGLLVRRFGFVTILVLGFGASLPVLFFFSFRLLQCYDDPMVPTIEPGESLIFHRRVVESDLKPGAVIVFKLPPRALVPLGGQRDEPVVARILAGPDDDLTIRDGHYVVNGELTQYRASVADPKAPGRVPEYPRKLIVPLARYFVVQDSTETGVDSQQLDYVRRMDVLSARIFRFGHGGLVRRVE